MNGNLITNILLGIVTTLMLGIGSYLISRQGKFEDIQNSQQVQIRLIIQRLDSFSDVEDNKSAISKHWRIHSWTRDQINILRTQSGLPVISWPPNAID